MINHPILCISDRAISVNIQIIRIFTRIRQMFIDNTELKLEIEKIKTKLDNRVKIRNFIGEKEVKLVDDS